MRVIDPMLMELEQEGVTTRRLLERVPTEKLDWRPHEKARSLGELAVHIATVQPNVLGMLQGETAEMSTMPRESVPSGTGEIVAMFDNGLSTAKERLGGMSDGDMLSSWSLVRDGKPIFTMPKAGVVRMIVLNHIYHHRGQLSTYLRTLGVALPSIYGPTADENPFA
jgi:uncharacterized damage-inducible protein DinB